MKTIILVGLIVGLTLIIVGAIHAQETKPHRYHIIDISGSNRTFDTAGDVKLMVCSEPLVDGDTVVCHVLVKDK
jgi:hypothetical protein